MKRIAFVVGAMAVMAVGAPTFAAQAHPTTDRHTIASPKRAIVRCPVTGQIVRDTRNAPKSVYKGKTYYFCCKGCKQAFDKNPAKYVK